VTGADPLFPEVEPYRTGMLALDGLHSMYWEESGNRDGVPREMLLLNAGACPG